MDIKYVSLDDISDYTGERIKGTIGEGERQFPLKLVTDKGTIYMDASESEIRNMLTQITNILENK